MIIWNCNSLPMVKIQPNGKPRKLEEVLLARRGSWCGFAFLVTYFDQNPLFGGGNMCSQFVTTELDNVK